MATPLTEATEVGTALGMCGFGSVGEALIAQPAAFDLIAPDRWAGWRRSYEETPLWTDWDEAWRNGQAFLEAADGLRGRPPRFIDWRGGARPSPDAVIPADLRVDHVYLVSCKYLSKVLFNGAPSGVFEGAMGLLPAARSADWFSEIAVLEHQALYEIVRRDLTAPTPPRVSDLTKSDRGRVRDALRSGWPSDDAVAAYAHLVAAVSERSAARWRDSIGSLGRQERVLWRLLRIYDAPYFVLGTAKAGPLRLRVATPWDWSYRFRLDEFDIEARPAGQPTVHWTAVVRDRDEGRQVVVRGHVEIRWSHGRFGGPPEAKIYLDTPLTAVPGYDPLV
jgi:hypothetical protein